MLPHIQESEPVKRLLSKFIRTLNWPSRRKRITANFISYRNNGVVTAEGFIDYYQELNATLPSEKNAYFVDLVTKTWNLLDPTQYITPEHMEYLEATMYEKVRQRTGPKEDEGKALLRAIRYVDTVGAGAITLEQFAKVLTNIGCLFKPEDVRALFMRFADESSGKICSDKIVNYFALKGSGNNPNVKPKFKVEAEPPNQVLAKIKKTLIERGTTGIRGLGILFRRIDDSGNRKIDRHEFSWAMKENGHCLSPLEFERLFKYFDRNNDGVINYDEFLRGVRGELNERRRAVVHEAFRKLDRTGDGRVMLDDLVGLYNVEKHPKVNSVQNEVIVYCRTNDQKGNIGRVHGTMGYHKERQNSDFGRVRGLLQGYKRVDRPGRLFRANAKECLEAPRTKSERGGKKSNRGQKGTL
eukprot:TRINITY_DN2633_c0_g1_i1.p4 TRINITY_DN2633_c0_g1~~TRINITY_DN2633_c0_g1_i1.p4  ORF type:complete len:412 (-),score=56.34 TRINITY_DN2633_c0_g1_i1:168-1403(-)